MWPNCAVEFEEDDVRVQNSHMRRAANEDLSSGNSVCMQTAFPGTYVDVYQSEDLHGSSGDEG